LPFLPADHAISAGVESTIAAKWPAALKGLKKADGLVAEAIAAEAAADAKIADAKSVSSNNAAPKALMEELAQLTKMLVHAVKDRNQVRRTTADLAKLQQLDAAVHLEQCMALIAPFDGPSDEDAEEQYSQCVALRVASGSTEPSLREVALWQRHVAAIAHKRLAGMLLLSASVVHCVC
jgi:hypothetical protein